MMLPAPIELLDLPADGELVTRVLRYEEGETRIFPAGVTGGKVIPVLRLHVPPEDKGTAPAYWDVTATTLHPSLRAQLPAAIAEKRWIRIRKYGIAPQARFAFELFPPGASGSAFSGVRR